jgi:hypothetical protein
MHQTSDYNARKKEPFTIKNFSTIADSLLLTVLLLHKTVDSLQPLLAEQAGDLPTAVSFC